MLEVVLFTQQGKRPSQEDRYCSGENQLSALPIAVQKVILRNTLMRLGAQLLADDNNRPCDDEDDCRAKFSGSTLVANLGDIWASVGDSLILLCTVSKDNEIKLTLVNSLHRVNRSEIALIHEKNKSHNIPATIQKQTPVLVGRGRLAGAAMTRAFGDFEAHHNGMHHEPDIGSFVYPEVKQAFIILASDGLIDFEISDQDHFKKEYQQIEDDYKRSQKTEADYLEKLDKLDKVDQEKLDAQLNLFQNEIKAHANAGEITAQGIKESLQKIIGEASNDNVTFIVQPAGQHSYAVVTDGHSGTQAADYLTESFSCVLKETWQAHIKRETVISQVKSLSIPIQSKTLLTSFNESPNITGNNTPTNGRGTPHLFITGITQNCNK